MFEKFEWAEPLRPYPGEYVDCPKCDGQMDKAYSVPRTGLDEYSEALHWTCLDCGFDMYTTTKDAE